MPKSNPFLSSNLPSGDNYRKPQTCGGRRKLILQDFHKIEHTREIKI